MDDIGFADQRKNRIRNFSKKTNKKYMLPIFSAKGGEYQRIPNGHIRKFWR